MAATIIRMRSTGSGDRREGIFAMFAVRQHKFGPPVALADAAAAHAALENRTAVGKVVLVP
ncbi:hypothetical protein [Nocardia amamiensis]|uniref:hypothetical protein n=1 Tax=Nocardia amamiensis TaxID=404578 RepID=UPI0008342977|nr:hypothetical protein [Nocardia amamiensis]